MRLTSGPHPRDQGASSKVVGLGAPICVWIQFEACEAHALTSAIIDELALYLVRKDAHEATRVDVTGGEDGWDAHIAELRRMGADVERARASTRTRFEVVWPTLLAHEVLRRVMTHAERVPQVDGETDRKSVV